MALFDLQQRFAPFMEFDRVSFRCYTKEEIEKLSVVHVTQTQTFDSENNAVKNGLYDPLFGPTKQGESCDTCGLREAFCPGHFGHITLCLPVFNPPPLHHHLRRTCFYCHRFIGKSSGPEAKILTAQLACIDKGLLSAAEIIQAEVTSFFDSHAIDSGGKTKMPVLTPRDEEVLLKQIKAVIAREMDENNAADASVKPVKNSVKLRDGLIKNFLKNHLTKHKVTCPHCKCRLGTIRNDQGRVLLLDIGGTKGGPKGGAQGAKSRADAPEDAYEIEEKKPEIKVQSTLNKALLLDSMSGANEDFLDKQIQQARSGAVNKLAWRAREVREHFRRVWQREQHIIRTVYPLFNTLAEENPQMECPLDVLFLETLMIPPTKFRPIRFFAGEKFESAMTANFRQLLETDEILRVLHSSSDLRSLSTSMKALIEKKTYGKTIGERIFNTYIQLQQRMNAVYDQAAVPNNNNAGLRQVLEKKEIRTGPDKYPGANFVQHVGKPKQRLLKEPERAAMARSLHCGKSAVSYVGQVEAAELVAVGHNYLVPKDGTPILGLIQDHVVSGPKINLRGKAKTPLSCWIVPGFREPSFDMSETEVVFRQGELLVGVLDKSHYGATQFGLIHCCFELYGPKVAVQILSCLSRLFPRYLQWHGFTLGVADILVTKEADAKRKQAINELRTTGPEITQKAFAMEGKPTKLQMRRRMANAYNNPQKDPTDVKLLDFAVKQTVAKYTDRINKACVPTGLIRSFPDNALQMMIQSGAKGSMVNSIQISCALGQIELEGQRPPLSCVGRTLPFVQRFLTGINPQELFFHTMAGREGLIDTAVKTSRSGYLQRCIIKHLEGLVVAYDYTVRDHDGGVVQFRYGEDGMDVAKSTFLSAGKFDFMADNQEAIRQTVRPPYVRDSEWKAKETRKYYRRLRKFREQMKSADDHKYKGGFVEFSRAQSDKLEKKAIVELWRSMSEAEQLELSPNRLPDSVDVEFHPAKALGALPERMLDEIHAFIKQHGEDENLRSTLFWKGDGANISTPMVEIEVRPETTDAQLEAMKREFTPVLLRDVIKKFTVEERLVLQNMISSRQYAITIHLKKNNERESYARHMKRNTIISRIEQTVGAAIAEQLARNYRDTLELDHVQHHRLRQSNTAILKKEEGGEDAMDATEIARNPKPSEEGASQICDYKFDTAHQRWCTVVFELPLKTKTKLNVAGIAQRVIEAAVVWRTKNIDKCVVREEKRGGQVVRILQTQKINVEALYKHAELLNVNTLYSNDVNMMLKYYGVEACARVIVKEMNNVFGVYGIEVNPRHLTLVGDHMTNTGSILPFSRGAMSNNSSPLQKMTYETTLSFMRDAIMRADEDFLDSPSARLVTGQTIRSGTGAFDLMPDPLFLKRHSKTPLQFYE
ncbi:DNA-directed RNA polymerase subunit [Aphelenchoides fujianensis]|nr:DNA-directed RNA polymerase subunit [Aphelenchoides fujianensis]